MANTPDLESVLRFLAQLKQNNHKTWFDAQRAEYEAARQAFSDFLEIIIAEFRESDHLGGLAPKECVARINRDIRFSKDKSPYKTNFGALVGPGGWKGMASGYYIALEPGDASMAAGGWYAPTPEQLNRFRQVVAEDAFEVKEIITQPEFMAVFGGLQGERLKTAPRGYDPAHTEIDLLKLKQVTVIQPFSDAAVGAEDFAGQVIRACRAMRPFLDWLDQLV
jgi:uncharacterized protein (TIGR02453 family)